MLCIKGTKVTIIALKYCSYLHCLCVCLLMYYITAFRPHGMRWGEPIATVVARNGWTDRDGVWWMTHVSPKNQVLEAAQVRLVKGPPRELTRRLCSLLPNCLATLTVNELEQTFKRTGRLYCLYIVFQLSLLALVTTLSSSAVDIFRMQPTSVDDQLN